MRASRSVKRTTRRHFDSVDDLFESMETEIAPGVMGVTGEEGDSLTVFWIRATREGSGAVGRYVDSLADRRHVRFIECNDRLAGLLARRGYVERQVSRPSGNGWARAMVRRPPAGPTKGTDE